MKELICLLHLYVGVEDSKVGGKELIYLKDIMRNPFGGKSHHLMPLLCIYTKSNIQ